MPRPSKTAIALLTAFTAALGWSHPAASGPTDKSLKAGETIFKTTCAACHGGDASGNLEMAAPPLTGQTPAYLARQLGNFRDGIRHQGDDLSTPAATMREIAKSLASESDLQAVAAYLGTLKAKPPKTPPQPATGAQGKSLFGVCVSCHGKGGEGNAGLNAPRIAGLPVWYLEGQLRHFKAETRGGHPSDALGKQMVAIAESLPDDDAVKAVAAFVAALPPTVKTP